MLDTSFRTHVRLLERINDLSSFLGDLHEPLAASRQNFPQAKAHVEAYCIEEPAALRDEQLKQEAKLIAVRIKRFLNKAVAIHDGDSERAVEAKDIAIITGTKAPLRVYAAALEQLGIPSVLAETDDLLSTREAQDGLALLKFLADPRDDLAVMALLRSPMFALSDVHLQTLAET